MLSVASPPERPAILVADDDAGVRRMLTGVLRRAGYRVLDAGDGAAALRLANAYSGHICLLITDVTMPAMAGPELARHFAPARPESRILFISGFTEPGTLAAVKKQPQAEYLRKPFSPKELLRRVQALVG